MCVLSFLLELMPACGHWAPPPAPPGCGRRGRGTPRCGPGPPPANRSAAAQRSGAPPRDCGSPSPGHKTIHKLAQSCATSLKVTCSMPACPSGAPTSGTWRTKKKTTINGVYRGNMLQGPPWKIFANDNTEWYRTGNKPSQKLFSFPQFEFLPSL